MSWTEERIERLKKMWHDGATASQIADEAQRSEPQRGDRQGAPPRPRSAALTGQARRGEGEACSGRCRPGAQTRAGRASGPRARHTRGRASRGAAADAGSGGPGARRPTRFSTARSAPAVVARVRASSRRRSRPLRRAVWCPPSRAPKSPTRPACSTSTTASASGRWATRASPTSTLRPAGEPGFPYCVQHCGVAYQAQAPAPTAAHPRPCRSAAREFAEAA